MTHMFIHYVQYSKHRKFFNAKNLKCRKIEVRETERYDEIVIAVYITRGILHVLRAREMTERLHIHFDKTTSRSDGALVEETEIRATGCEREVGCCAIQAHVDLFACTCLRPSGGLIVLAVRKSVSLYFLYVCVRARTQYTHIHAYIIVSSYRQFTG